ncbi:MAG: hypothetical protein K0S38_222 [Candidatus Paceibacter sp.]|nr:hypothetical protein [Candidatus Paceibacter sp.]
MKKLLLGLVIVIAVAPLVVGASEFQSGNSYALQRNQVVGSDLYVAGGTVSVDGAVQGDAVLAGGTITLTGSTTQSVLAAGGNLSLRGTVGDDIRAAGGNVSVGGVVTHDVVLAGGQVIVESGTTVGGDAVLAGGSVTMAGQVAGKALLTGGDIIISGTVNGPVDVQAGSLTISKTAIIRGSLTYHSPNPATIENGSQIAGPINYTPIAKPSPASHLVPAFVKFLTLFVSALLLGLVLKRLSFLVVSHARMQFWWSLLRGCILLIVTPFVVVILLVTVIGIPLGVIVLLLYIAMIMLAYLMTPIIAGALLNKWVFKQPEYDVTWQTILIGTAAVVILSYIPFIGWLANFILLLMVLGSFTRHGNDWLMHRNIAA